MLNAKELNEVILSAAGDGVQLVVLLDSSTNAVLSSAYAGECEKREEIQALTISAVANMWRAYARNDLTVNKLSFEAEPESLEQMVVDFGTRKLCVMATGGRALLALLTSDSEPVEMGMLKLKTSVLHRTVDALLRPVMSL